jgi:hypothetical protein
VGVDSNDLAVRVDRRAAARSARSRQAMNDEARNARIRVLIRRVERRHHRRDDAPFDARNAGVGGKSVVERIVRIADDGDRAPRREGKQLVLTGEFEVGTEQIGAARRIDRIDEDEACIHGEVADRRGLRRVDRRVAPRRLIVFDELAKRAEARVNPLARHLDRTPQRAVEDLHRRLRIVDRQGVGRVAGRGENSLGAIDDECGAARRAVDDDEIDGRAGVRKRLGRDDGRKRSARLVARRGGLGRQGGNLRPRPRGVAPAAIFAECDADENRRENGEQRRIPRA